MDKLKNQQKEKIFKTISGSLSELGFQRTKSTFWVKELSNTIQFIHIHTFSFNYSFRIHLGIRVKNDSFKAVSLNGPCSFDGWWKSQGLFSKKRELVFNEKVDSINICSNNVLEFVKTIGLIWFSKFTDDHELLTNQDSPLKHDEKVALNEMIDGNEIKKNIDLSNKILRLDRLKISNNN